MDKLHKAVAVLGAIAMIAIPIVEHSAYGGNHQVQLSLSLMATALGVLGFTAAKPALVGDPQEFQRTHRTIAILGNLFASMLPTLAQTYGDHASIKLVLDIAAGVLGAIGFMAVRP